MEDSTWNLGPHRKLSKQALKQKPQLDECPLGCTCVPESNLFYTVLSCLEEPPLEGFMKLDSTLLAYHSWHSEPHMEGHSFSCFLKPFLKMAIWGPGR